MADIDLFLIFWTGMVLFITISSVVLGIVELRSGTARTSLLMGAKVHRSEEPAHYWVAVIGKLIALPIGAFMIWFVLNAFWR